MPKTAADLRQRPTTQTVFQHLAEIRQTHRDQVDRLTTLTEQDQLKASEQRELEQLCAELDRLNALAQTVEASDDYRSANDEHMLRQRSTVPHPNGPRLSAGYRDGAPLDDRQTFSGYVRARGLVSEQEQSDQPLSLARCLRGALFQDWTGAAAEQRAMSGLSGAAGGFALPTVLSAEIIDLARSQTRVLEAGARIIPMGERTLDVAKWVSDPDPGWRGEGEAIPESNATIGKLTLEAKTLAVYTKITRELLEDASEIEDQLRLAFAAGFAKKLDIAALYGGGAKEPVGLKATAAVTKTPLAANGASPTWDAVVNSVGRLRDANETPNAMITADRTLRTLGMLKDNTLQYLPAPSYLDGIARYSTSEVPKNLTVGTSNDTTDLFVGDFTQLYIGIRTQLQIGILSERFMVEEGSYALVGWWRGDVAVARPAAFDVVTGIRP